MINKYISILVPILMVCGISMLLFQQKELPTELENIKDHHSPEDWMYRQRAFPHGSIKKDIYLNAMQEWQALNNARSTQDQTWELAGPTNIGGRITSLAVKPDDDQTIYVGAASGGVFKTTDGGQNWLPIFDDAASLSIGDLAIAPSQPQTLYVGTGEANAGGGSLAYDGAGMYKSTDGGDSWTPIGLEKTGSTGKVLVHPQQPDRVYVATMGSLFANQEDRGLYRTTNGGQNWEKILYISDSTGVIDLAIHPTQPNILFAASWERIRRPNRRQYSGKTSGIYRSTDNGDNWEKLNLPINSNIPIGRIGLTASPVKADRIYASVVDGRTDALLGVYQSDDNGDNWNVLTLNGITQVPFMWWFGKIYADPIDANLIYLCGLNFYRYKAGDSTWENKMPGVHVDQHALYIEPDNRDFILLGNDGGLYKGEGDLTQNIKHFDNIPITQFYTSEIDYQAPDRLLGGTQDNGSIRKNPGETLWTQILGGDGFVNIVDPSNSKYVYAESQYGNLFRSTNFGNNFQPGRPQQSASETKNWNTPVILDPILPSTIYYGAQRVHRSTNRGINWTPISPGLVRPPAGSTLAFGTLTSLAVSPADTRIIYAGADDGSLFISQNDGGSWENISDDLPNRWITRISTHPTASRVAYVTFSGYRWNEYLPHVFRTDDNGFSWTDISAGLPEVPVNDLVINPERPEQLFLATDAGIFVSENEGLNWEILGEELPKVVVNDLTYHPPTRTLLAGTYGRSMYKLELDEQISSINNQVALVALKAYPNPFQGQTQIQIKLKKSTDLSIAVYDLNGRLIQKLHQGSLPEGSHSFDFHAEIAGSYLCKLQSANGSRSLLLGGL